MPPPRWIPPRLRPAPAKPPGTGWTAAPAAVTCWARTSQQPKPGAVMMIAETSVEATAFFSR